MLVRRWMSLFGRGSIGQRVEETARRVGRSVLGKTPALAVPYAESLSESLPGEWRAALRPAPSSSSSPAADASFESVRGAVVDPYAEVQRELDIMQDSINENLRVDHPVMRLASQYYFSLQGKRMRPLMVLLMSKAINAHLRDEVGGEDAPLVTQSQLSLAEITEMIHVASLTHDDVIDRADTRRGAQSLNAKFGNKVSVLAGDFLLGRASSMLARLRNTEVVELLSKVIEHLALGEVMQMSGVLPPEELEDQAASASLPEGDALARYINGYMNKSYFKTASLVANSCRATVLLGSPAESQEQRDELMRIAHSFGRHIGYAYQLIDDTLDFVGDEESLGKPAMADLKAGLVTAPVLLAAREKPALMPLIERSFSRSTDLAQGFAVVGDEFRSGASATLQLALWHTRQAALSVSQLRPSRPRDALISLAFKLSQRTR